MKVLARDVAQHYCPGQLSTLSAALLPTTQPAQPPVPSQAITVYTSSVQEVKATILELEERFSDLISDTEEEICEKENRDKKFLNRFRNRLLVLPVTRKPIHIKFFS